MRPESKLLQCTSIYVCEVILCCGLGDGTGKVVLLLPPHCAVGVMLDDYLRLPGLIQGGEPLGC